MNEWKKWLNADYAFSNNGEKIKKVVKASYTISLVLFFCAAALYMIYFFIETFEGYFEYIWFLPLIIIVAVFLAPFLIYWSLSTLYGFGELVSNSYGKDSGDRAIENVKEERKEKDKGQQKEKNKTENKTFSTNKTESTIKRINIIYVAEEGAPEVATYCIDNGEPRHIKSGQTITEYIKDDYYKLEVVAGRLGRFKQKGIYLAIDDSTKKFVCTRNKLEEK